MDNTTSPVSDLDLNPDMMTTQSSIPVIGQVPPVPPAAPASMPTNSGVIDITPGHTLDLHPSPVQPVDEATLPENQVVDITPDGDAPSELTESTHLSDIIPQQSSETVQPVTAPVLSVSTEPVIVPDSPISDILHEVGSTPSLTPLAQPDTIGVSAVVEPTLINSDSVNSLTETQTNTPPATIDVTVPSPTTATSAFSATPTNNAPQLPQTEASPENNPVLNPLYEDPDIVKLAH